MEINLRLRATHSEQSSSSGPNYRWQPARFFMIRAPALPVESFSALPASHDSSWPPANGDPVAAILRDPFVALALRVASTSITQAIDAGPTKANHQARLRRSVLAYLTRMSTRATPFGLFAGVALAEWGDRTEIALSGPPAVWRARPDMGWLYALLARLERDPEVRARVVLRKHPGIIIRAGRVMLLGVARGEKNAGPAEVSIRATPVVLEVLAHCENGMQYSEVVEAIHQSRGAAVRKVRNVIDTMCEQGFLLTDLRPPLNGSPARHLEERLRACGAAPATAAALRQLLLDLATWEALPAAEALRSWQSLNAAAQALEVHEPAFQVDAGFGGSNNRLRRAVTDEVTRAVNILLRISPWPNGSPGLAAWRSRFEETYGVWREAPVLDVIDPDRGLGLPDMRVPEPRRPMRDRLLLRLAYEAIRSGERIVELDEPRIAALERACGGPGQPPRSLDFCCAIAAETAAAVDDGRFLLVVNRGAGVAPAGRTFGRFNYIFGEESLSFLREAQMAHAADVTGGELMFEPAQPRIANVMIRPLLQAHVIPVNGGAPIGDAQVIPLEELAVSLRGSRLRLRWMRGGVEVEASYLHMLNYGLAPALAQFLYAVSHDGEALIDRFSWGPAAYLPFRPRVQVGCVVLRPAEWSLGRDFCDVFLKDPSAARDRAGLPRFVLLGRTDELLLLDLDSAVGAELLLREARKLSPRASLEIQEALPSPEHAWVEGSDGHRLLELVVPLFLDGKNSDETPGQLPRPQIARSERLRPPASDWLYGKFYLSRRLADWVIGEPLRELVEELSAANNIFDWFFVRYADPAFHLRLRFAGDPAVLLAETLPSVCAWASRLMEHDVLDHFAFDTYQREVERYGGPDALLLVERLFTADSVAVANLLATRHHLATALERHHLAVYTVDDLLDALGFEPVTRVQWYRRFARRGYGKEYRTSSDQLRALLGASWGMPPDPRVSLIQSILAERRAAVREIARGLASLDDRKALWTPFPEIVRSLVHMHCNRLCGEGFKDEQRVLALAVRTLTSLVASPPTRG